MQLLVDGSKLGVDVRDNLRVAYHGLDGWRVELELPRREADLIRVGDTLQLVVKMAIHPQTRWQRLIARFRVPVMETRTTDMLVTETTYWPTVQRVTLVDKAQWEKRHLIGEYDGQPTFV